MDGGESPIHLSFLEFRMLQLSLKVQDLTCSERAFLRRPACDIPEDLAGRTSMGPMALPHPAPMAITW